MIDGLLAGKGVTGKRWWRGRWEASTRCLRGNKRKDQQNQQSLHNCSSRATIFPKRGHHSLLKQFKKRTLTAFPICNELNYNLINFMIYFFSNGDHHVLCTCMQNNRRRVMRIVCSIVQVYTRACVWFPGSNRLFHPSFCPCTCLWSHAWSWAWRLIRGAITKANPFQLSSPSALPNVTTTGEPTDSGTSHS